uniref:NADH-ubiquinone oxidoreductase chain 6 n=1 Tax=Acanthosaura lepidogaster TaxID=118088 RepID=A0A0U2H678_9SAUR|nr:NADH dehydrogenase subunit 6 [Acanthosaura lepidogaster]
MYLVFLLSVGVFASVVGVVSNPSPCFAVGALVLSVGLSCGVLAGLGMYFLALVVFLVYLGGMLVVFAYTVAMSYDLIPGAWGGFLVGGFVLFYFLMAVVWSISCGFYVSSGCMCPVVVGVGLGNKYSEIYLLYGVGGWILFVVAGGLLLTLLVVLELVRGVSFGAHKMLEGKGD